MIQLQQRRDLQKLLDHIDHWPAVKEKDSEPQRARRLKRKKRPGKRIPGCDCQRILSVYRSNTARISSAMAALDARMAAGRS